MALRPPEAAKALGVSQTTLKGWIRDGTVRSVLVGNTRLVLVSSLRKLLGEA
jgi:excisionase family DNA binding protein